MAHAKLSPSASKRWMNCPGSVALIGDAQSTTSKAAMLGTAAHKLIELVLITVIEALKAGQTPNWSARSYAGSTFLVKAAGDEEVEFYPAGQGARLTDESGAPRAGWHMFIADEKMIEGVQMTLDEVKRVYASMRPGTEIYTERYLDGSWLDPRLGGTADVTLVEVFGRVVLIDHKNGYMTVEARENDQLKQYAVFLLHEHPECDPVTVTISQPNAPHADGLIRSQTFTSDELAIYQLQMKEAADATSDPKAPRRAGEWCTFCPAKTTCPEFDAVLRDQLRAEFFENDDDAFTPQPIALPRTPSELASKLKWVSVIESWVSQVKTDAQRELENGNAVPGWKLVRGRSKRRWKSEDKVVTTLTEEIGLGEDDIHVAPRLKTPAQIEKLGTGREQRNLVKKAVQALAFMPPGSLTLVPVTDPRDAVSSMGEALIDFVSDDENDADEWSFD